jgi:hypothetical protein
MDNYLIRVEASFGEVLSNSYASTDKTKLTRKASSVTASPLSGLATKTWIWSALALKHVAVF